MLAILPRLSPEEVERFVALGEKGDSLVRENRLAEAEAAFRAQTAIFAANPDPHVSLALVAALRGDEKAALDHLRDAVLRGFTDLARIERAEAWTRLKGNRKFLYLQDDVPLLLEAERKWAGWDEFEAMYPPKDVASVVEEHEQRRILLDRTQPALGERYTRLWNRLNDRLAAARLEAYVSERPDAEDLRGALERLMELYTGGSLLRWDPLSSSAASRLAGVADVALERFGETSLRPGALVCRALARRAERDEKGRTPPEALEAVRASLGEVLERYADSPFVVAAAEGLVRTESEAGEPRRAAEVYRAFRRRHAGDPELLAEVRDRLGALALHAGGMPEFTAETLDGGAVEREALLGKVVVMDFWATWCRPCIDGFPTLRRIEKRYGDEVTLVGVNLDRSDILTAEALRHWLEHEQVPGVQLRDGHGWDSELVKAFTVREIPFTVVADERGEILAVGAHGKELHKAVKAAVRRD